MSFFERETAYNDKLEQSKNRARKDEVKLILF